MLHRKAAVSRMVAPDTSGPRDIDLFRVDQPLAKSAEWLFPSLGSAYMPLRRRRYHSIQLALVTGVFACGGFTWSLLVVDRSEEFPQPHHWLRQSYSPPSVASMRQPTTTTSDPALKSSIEDKNTMHLRRIAARKPLNRPAHIARTNPGFRPLVTLRGSWTNFTGYLRRNLKRFNFSPDFVSRGGSSSQQPRQPAEG